jgi:3-phenylpropionate/trans-cinnamate dioxygenase ferredoxin component
LSGSDDQRFVRVCKTTDIKNGTALSFKFGTLDLAIFHTGGKFYAITDICSHEHEHLSEGWLEDSHIECPRHGAMFDLITGAALSLPATEPIETFPLEIRDGDIVVGIPNVYLDEKSGV